MRFSVLLASLVCLVLCTTGCGISQETKAGTNAVFGYDGILDKYLDVAESVNDNLLIIMEAVRQQQGDDFELTVTRADGQQAKVKITEWIAALKLLKDLPAKIKEAAHAVNDAVQADKGLSAFTEQLLRTLKADKVLDWFLGSPDGG
jgi:hypothetical protein